MKTKWTKDLDKDRADEISSQFKASKSIRDRLTEMIKTMYIEPSLKSMHSLENYNIPNWQFSHADKLGYIRALHEILSLLEDK